MLTVLFFSALSPCQAAEQTPPSFSEANAKYKAGDFKAAAQMYEALIESGQNTGTVYYNLGNADFRLGKKGEALIAYERAKRIRPRDETVRWNLSILKSVLPDKLEPSGRIPMVARVDEGLDRISLYEMTLALSVLIFILAMLAVLNLFIQPDKRWTRPLRRLVFTALLLVSAAFAWKWNAVKDARVVVLDREVYARYGPSETETKAFLVHEGAEGRVLDDSKEWFYIALPNHNSGWIPRSSCEVI